MMISVKAPLPPIQALRNGMRVLGPAVTEAEIRSRIMDHRCSVEIGNVRIEPGGLISGDMDGVLVVPRAIEEEPVARA
jgi:4-hydroxy-4-methyl-2-oxoglutarate aldolase